MSRQCRWSAGPLNIDGVPVPSGDLVSMTESRPWPVSKDFIDDINFEVREFSIKPEHLFNPDLGGCFWSFDDVRELEGQLFAVDRNRSTSLLLNQQGQEKFPEMIGYLRDNGFLGEDDDSNDAKEDDIIVINQVNPLTKGKQEGAVVSDEFLLEFNNIPVEIIHYLEGSWCNGPGSF